MSCYSLSHQQYNQIQYNQIQYNPKTIRYQFQNIYYIITTSSTEHNREVVKQSLKNTLIINSFNTNPKQIHN